MRILLGNLCIRAMVWLTGLIVVAACSAAAVEPPLRPTFKISFEKGLTADQAGGAAEPVNSRNVTLVEGLNGQGAYIPRDGFLLYSLEGNLPREHGTLVMYVKADWAAPGRSPWWLDAEWKGVFCTAKDGGIPSREVGSVGTILRAMQDATLHYAWYGEGGSANAWYHGYSDFPAGTWRCYAFTWDQARGIRFYLDGEEKSVSPPIVKAIGDADGFYLGSAICLGGVRGFAGVIDDVTIYDGALSAAQLLEMAAVRAPMTAELMDMALLAGQPRDLRIRYRNRSAKAQQKAFSLNVLDVMGKEQQTLASRVSLEPGAEATETVRVSVDAPGVYALRLADGSTPLSSFQIMAIEPQPLNATMPVSRDGATQKTLLETIDCAAEYGPEKYRDDGHCRVETSDIGSWRVAEGGKKLSGFIYLMKVTHPGRPHWLEIEYPDNAQRAFYVAVLQEHDGRIINGGGLDNIGVLTGDRYPLTHTMQKKRLLFWPDSENLTIGCFVHIPYPGEMGAALSKIRLYEIEGQLPKSALSSTAQDSPRLIGPWNEDPNMPKSNWLSHVGNFPEGDTLDFWKTKWERTIEYLYYTGQNLWTMETMVYSGDLGTSEALPQAGSYHKGWSDLGALMLERENLGFFVEIQDMYRLNGNAGKAGIGGLGRTVGPEYLSANLEESLAKGEDCLDRFNNENQWCGAGMAEPLHPQIQEAYLKIIRENAGRFAVYDSFKGIGLISVPNWSNLMYANIRQGYGDYPVKAFEMDTGLTIPVDPTAPDRFGKRYDWLMANARERWIHWRAEKLADFYRRIVATLQAVAPGRQFLLMDRISFGADDYYFATWPSPDSDLKRFWLERGIDIDRVGTIDSFLLMPAVKPNLERAGLNFEARQHNQTRNERYYGFSPELADAYRNAPRHGAFIVQHCDMESYGGFAPEQVTSHFFKLQGKSHVVYTIPLPVNQYALEHAARLAADFNPRVFYHGWWGNPDNGAIDVYQSFYRGFRSLPLLDFANIPGASDPVQCKIADDGTSTCLALINREYYPVKVEMTLREAGDVLDDLVTGNGQKIVDDKLTLDFAPYEIKCFRGAGGLNVEAATQTVPETITRDLEKTLKNLRKASQTFDREKLRVAGLPEVLKRAEKAWSERQYSYLHYLLQSGPAYEALKHADVFSSIDLDLAQALRLQNELLDSLRNRGSACINCAGVGKYTDPDGRVWLPDQPYSARLGTYGNQGANFVNRGEISIAGSTAVDVYRTEAWGDNVTYRIPVPNGKYVLKLHFAETFENNKDHPGCRSLTININGRTLDQNVDFITRAGGFRTAYVWTSPEITDDGGILTVDFPGHGCVNGIEIVRKEAVSE